MINEYITEYSLRNTVWDTLCDVVGNVDKHYGPDNKAQLMFRAQGPTGCRMVLSNNMLSLIFEIPKFGCVDIQGAVRVKTGQCVISRTISDKLVFAMDTQNGSPKESVLHYIKNVAIPHVFSN